MILRSDLPIKYCLNLYGKDEIYDQYCVLFDILQYLIKVAHSKNKKIDQDALKFSSKSLKYIFGDKINDEVFKLNIVKQIKTLITTEHLIVDGDTLYITKKGLTNFYITE